MGVRNYAFFLNRTCYVIFYEISMVFWFLYTLIRVLLLAAIGSQSATNETHPAAPSDHVSREGNGDDHNMSQVWD